MPVKNSVQPHSASLLFRLTFVFIFVFSFNCFSQNGIEWQKTYGGIKNDIPYHVIQTSDHGYFVVGSSESGSVTDTFDVKSNFGGSDYWVMKTDINGMLQWQRHYGGASNDVANQAIQMSDGGFLIGGYSFSLNGDVSDHDPGTFNASGELIPNADFWVVKIGADGAIQWEKAIGGSYVDEAFSMIQTSDGHIMLAGSSASNNKNVTGNHGGYDFLLVNLDMFGNLIWTKTYGGSGDDRATSIIECKEGGFLLSGFSNSQNKDLTENFGLYDYWTIRLNAAGEIVWQKSLGGSDDDRIISALETPDGGFALAGITWSHDVYVNKFYGQDDGWLVKIDKYGNVQWEKTIGGTDGDVISTLLLAPDSGFVISGYSYSHDFDIPSNRGSADAWISKLDKNGNASWSKTFGGSGNDQMNCVIRTFDGGYLFAASSSSADGDLTSGYGNNDFWLVKLSASVGISEEAKVIFNDQIFPNPSNGLVNLNFENDMIRNEKGKVSVLDITGRIMFEKEVNSNSLSLDLSALDCGIYTIQRVTPSQTTSKKLIIQK